MISCIKAIFNDNELMEKIHLDIKNKSSHSTFRFLGQWFSKWVCRPRASASLELVRNASS